MPDIPVTDINRLPSELATGLFSDRMLATRLDTQERLDDMFGNFNVPPITYIPKDLSTNDLLASDSLPRIKDYLDSPDPKLRNLGKEYLEQDMSKNLALTKGVGLPDMVRYAPGQEKFTNQHWWSESGKTKFGYNPDISLAENEDLYHREVWDNYSFFGKLWRQTGTFSLRVLSKIVTGLVGMVGDASSMAWNGIKEINEATGGPSNNFWANVSDNWLSRAMSNLDDFVKQEIVPTYRAIDYDNKGAFAKLTDPYFWANDMADGAGFLLQFALPATALGKLTKLSKIAVLAEDANMFQKFLAAGVGELETASRFQKASGAVLETLTGSRNVGGISAHVWNTTMESVAETKDGFKESVKGLMEKGYTEAEAKKISAEHAPTQFGLNMFILTFSNALENKWFQKAAGNRGFWSGNVAENLNLIERRAARRASIRLAKEEAIKTAEEKAAKIAAKTTVAKGAEGVGQTIGRSTAKALNASKGFFGSMFDRNILGDRIVFYGKRGLTATIMEGFWEENAQQAATRVAAGHYMRRGDDTPFEGTLEKSMDFWSQLWRQTVDASWWGKGDREVADSIMAGAVMGVLGGAGFAKLSGDKVKGKLLPLGERKTIEKENIERVESIKNARAAWMDINVMPEDMFVKNADGTITIDEAKAKQKVTEIQAKLDKIQSMFTRKVDIEDITDPVKRQQMQHILFGDFVRGHIMHGTGLELIQKLRNWSAKSKEELAQYGVTDQMQEDPTKWADIAQKTFDDYHKIEQLKFHNTLKLKPDEFMRKAQAIRAHLFDWHSLKNALDTSVQQYQDLEDQYNPFNKDASLFNTYNALVAKAEWYRQHLEDKDMPEDVKKELKPAYDDMVAKLKEMKDTLPQERESSMRSDFLFEKGTAVNTKEAEILQTVGDYLHFQFYKEANQKGSQQAAQVISDYSDPDKAMSLWGERITKFNDIIAKIKLKKLQDMGYSEAEVVNMTPEEVDRIIAEDVKKADNPDIKEEEKVETPEVKTEPVVPAEEKITSESLRPAALQLMQVLTEGTTEENLDENIGLLLAHISANPTEMTDEERKALKPITDYIEKKTEEQRAEKSGQFAEEAKSQTESTPEENEESNDLPPVSSTSKEEKADDSSEVPPPPPPPSDNPPPSNPDSVPPNIFDEVKEAYRLHLQALENDTTFEEEAGKEGMRIHNNRIDNSADKGKNEGTINVVTSNPKDLEKGALKTTNNNLARFNFLDKLASGKLKKSDFKLVLRIGKNGGIFGVVSDKNGNPIKIDDTGVPSKDGNDLLFYLDGFDLYSEANIGKRRSQVIQPPFALAPLTATPITLHPSFEGKNVLAVLKDIISNGNVTASIDFVTQGMLFRDGMDNSFNIPKGAATKTATSLFEKGHMEEEKGLIPSENVIVDGVFQKAHRIQFRMLKDVNNLSAGTEVVEFHPVKISEATTEDGKSLLDVLKAANGQNIFEAAISGNLPATADNINTLTTLLRPDKFLVLNLGTVIQVINLKNFKKLISSTEVTYTQLMGLTKIEDIYNSELNINKAYYDSTNELSLLSGLLGESNDNYSRFVNRNVVTSADTITTSPGVNGYARINKRMTLILDKNMEELSKDNNQEKVAEAAPNTTIVKTSDEGELSDDDILSLLNEENPTINEDIITKKDCE